MITVRLLALWLCITPLFAVAAMQPADLSVQRMALEMNTADCDTLMGLDTDTKYAFLLMSMMLQREGSLSRIIGPDCEFLGKASVIAKINDTALTLSNQSEMLYYLPDWKALFVSNAKNNSIAYGMFLEGSDTPFDYFLFHRDSAEDAVTIAQGFTPPPAPSRSSSRSISIQQSSSSTPIYVPTTEFTPPTYTDTSFDTALDSLPVILPIGPFPQPEIERSNKGYWALLTFMGLVIVGALVVYIRHKRTSTL